MFVDEAPNNLEVTQEVVFGAGAGYVMSQLAGKAEIDLGSCFLTHVMHQPVGEQFAKVYKNKALAVQYLQGVLQLKKDIEEIKPNVVAALGDGALRALTGKTGIRNWRGSILESTLVPGVKVIPTYTPDFVIKMYDYRAVMDFDIRRIAEESKYPDIRLPKRTYYFDPIVQSAHRETRETIIYGQREQIIQEMLRADLLSVDIECVPDGRGGWKLSCVGFSDRADRALVIPAISAAHLHDIRRLLQSPVKKIYQNGSFDVTVLTDNGIAPENFYYDTMIGHHVMFPESASGESEMSQLEGKKRQAAIAKGLAFQASVYTKEPYYKEDGKISTNNQDWWLHYLYNGRDTAVTREIADVQIQEIHKFGQEHILDWKMRAVPATLAATRRGIKIDLEERARYEEDLHAEIDRLQQLLDHMAGGPLNVKSSQQIQKFLYEKLGLPPKRNRKTGNTSADKDAIIELAHKHNNPGLLAILKIRERRDLLERYVSAKVDADGRIRCSIDITGTRSDRFSSRASIYGSGTNLQNIPTRTKAGQRIKRFFIADPGKVLVQLDYKQAEAWLVAYESRCHSLIELFQDSSRDVHKENASRMFNKPVSEVTFEERYLAKKVVHASNYGMGPARLVQIVAQESEVTGIRLTFHEADMLMQKYFMLYPEIKDVMWREAEDEIRRSRMLTNAFGRKRMFFGRMDDKLIREAYSYKPQSTVGLLGVMAFTKVYEEIELGMPELGCEVLMQVHDSVLTQCDIGKERETIEAMTESMRIPITVHGETFVIPTDAEVGRNWAKASEDNPDGMKELKVP